MYDIKGKNVFITAAGKGIGRGVAEVLGYDDGKPVIIRKGNVLGMTFHPELTGKNKHS